VIRDVVKFRRAGVASRWVTELDIPVAAWRAAMCRAGRQDGARVRTFLLPRTIDANDPRDQLVFAVRTDPPPDLAVEQQGLVRWWRIDELNMPYDRWRAALHRIARREHAGSTPSVPQPRSPTEMTAPISWSTSSGSTGPIPAGHPPHPQPQRRRAPMRSHCR
jgi:hypothetical protein